MTDYTVEYLTTQARLARTVLLIFMIGQIVRAAIIGVNFWMLARSSMLTPAEQSFWVRLDIMDAPFLLLFWGAVPFVAVWIHGASSNANALKPDLESSPAWAVAWFFIPVASLWMPYQAMRETWDTTFSTVTKADRPERDYPARWWVFWIGSGVAGFVADQVSKAHHAPAVQTLANCFWLAAVMGSILAAKSLREIIRLVTAAQNATLVDREVHKAAG